MPKRVSATELHDLLTREFRKSAGDLCLKCSLPMPAYFAGAKQGPNWRLGPLDECAGLCHSIVQDIVERMARTYALTPPKAARASGAAGGPRPRSR